MPTRVSGAWRSAALLLMAAFALRLWDFGNPVIHVDEQYYLLVGDRMLHGAVPYIDIWDRKPIGLFALYAAIRLLPGDGIVAYQVTATLFVAATAWLVWRMARGVGADRDGAMGAAVAYLILVSLLGGRGGQSPVFYNLFVAGAAALTLRLPALVDRRAGRSIVANGIAACLLGGIAIQMKYTPAVEGAFFGAAHLWAARRAGFRPRTLAFAGALWLAAGIGPSAAVAAYYLLKGPAAFHAFWFANIVSIGLRPGYPLRDLLMRLLGIGAQLSPLILCAALGWRGRRGDAGARARLALAHGWLIAALLGFFAIGTFFDHYALPLAAPLCVAAAPFLGRSRRALVATLGLGLLLFTVERFVHRDDASGARALAQVVARNSNGGCPYVFIGDTATYLLANSCLPTAYAFPNLLAYRTEQGATGIDEAAEVRRILAGRPPLIVTSDRRLSIWNPGSVGAVKAALARRYRLVFVTRRASWHSAVYLRRDLPYRR